MPRNKPAALKVDGAGKRGTRLPEEWRPSQELWQWARAERPDLSEADLKSITEDFIDYWLSKTGADATKIYWDRTYKVWIRRAWKPGGSRQASHNNPYQGGVVF